MEDEIEKNVQSDLDMHKTIEGKHLPLSIPSFFFFWKNDYFFLHQINKINFEWGQNKIVCLELIASDLIKMPPLKKKEFAKYKKKN